MVLLVTTTLTSHSNAKPGLVGPLADSAHLLAGSVWAGGLVMLTLGLISLRVLEPESCKRMATEVVARFSGLASASVGLLVASGLVLSSGQVASWPGLLLTAYGQTLLFKLLVVCVAFGFGMYNSLRLRHMVSVGMEAAVVAGVIFAAAFLTDLPPARTALANPGADQAGLALNNQAAGLTLTGQVRPARLGNNVFEWQIVNAAGAPERDLQIEVSFQPVGGGALVSSLTLAESEAGVYSATGSPFQREGPWQLLLTLSRPEGDPILTTFDVSVGPDGVVRLASDPLPAPVRAVVWLERYGQVMLAGLVLALTAGWGWVIWQTHPSVGRSPMGWLAVGLLIAALIWFMLALSTQN